MSLRVYLFNQMAECLHDHAIVADTTVIIAVTVSVTGIVLIAVIVIVIVVLHRKGLLKKKGNDLKFGLRMIAT